MQATAITGVGHSRCHADVVHVEGDTGQGGTGTGDVLDATTGAVGLVGIDGGGIHRQCAQVQNAAAGTGCAVGGVIGDLGAAADIDSTAVVEYTATAVIRGCAGGSVAVDGDVTDVHRAGTVPERTAFKSCGIARVGATGNIRIAAAGDMNGTTVTR